jgi:hypothetical protein
VTAPAAAAATRGTGPRGGSPRRRGPIRGYPPMPGQPGPVYPPGQFSGWNRLSVRATWLGMNGNGAGPWEGGAGPWEGEAGPWEGEAGPWEGEAEPGYSVLATSDPSADATVTQTWAAMDDADGGDVWSPPPLARDVSAHTDGEGIPRVQRAGGRAATGPRAASESAAPAQQASSRRLAPWESGNLPAMGPAGPVPAAASPPGALGAPPGAPGPGSLPATGRADARRGPGGAGGTGGSPPAGRGPAAAPAGRRGGGLAMPSHRALIGLLLAPVVIVILVVAVIVYLGSRPVPTAGNAAAPSKPAVSPTPSPSLGPWRDITSQAVDAVPLSVSELYPARFAFAASAGVRTVDKADASCTSVLIGPALRSAVRKGGCTQVIRASYLSTNRKIMATIGVLNLADVAAAEKAGKATGAAEFIRQLPGPHGPTHNLAKGTGLEEAEVKGHYLILIWTEFANLHAPSGKKQRKQLTTFSADLFAGTANVSLTSRMVTGKPSIP